MRYWLVILFFLTACRGQPTPTLLPVETRYFPQTNQIVQGDFLRFFDTYGGEESFGLPLTGEIMADGWRVQYFEKARLEYHPENQPAYHVTAGWLGELLRRHQPPVPTGYIPAGNDPSRRYYPQTGHTLSGDFLTYFDAHGGPVRFGLPIGEPFLDKGRITQDFQSIRFFWSPDNDPPVILEDIGRIYLESVKVGQ